MADGLLLFLRGFVMVGLVSWQTRALQIGELKRIALGSFLIGCFWYTNVIAADGRRAPCSAPKPTAALNRLVWRRDTNTKIRQRPRPNALEVVFELPCLQRGG